MSTHPLEGVPAPTLRLSRSTLRSFRPEDAPALVRHGNNERIARNLRDAFPSPYTPADAERWLAMATTAPRSWILAIDLDGEAAGGIGIHGLADVYRCGAEIGYWLSEQHWGRGIVTEAVTALSRQAFARTALVRLHAGVYSTNPASMRVLEKAGFHLEAIHRRAVLKRGVLCDEHVYCKLR